MNTHEEDSCSPDIPLYDRNKACDRPGCAGRAWWADMCGCYVCDRCEKHHGLARCYCGWSASGGNGRDELEEMGEVIGYDY